MKLSVSAYRAHASAHKKILDTAYQLNYGSTSAASTTGGSLHHHTPYKVDPLAGDESTTPLTQASSGGHQAHLLGPHGDNSGTETPVNSPRSPINTSREEDDSSNANSSDCKSPSQRYGPHSPGTKSNQRWMKLRTTVQISSAIQKKPPLKREDSFLKRFSTRQIPETQETVEDTNSESGAPGTTHTQQPRRRRRYQKSPRTVVNPDENFYFYWLLTLTICVLYNLWTLIVRQSFPEFQILISNFWFACDGVSDFVFLMDVGVQLRTGYLEQGLMVYDSKKLAGHYLSSRAFLLDLGALCPLDLLQIRFGPQPMLRFPRFLKVYRAVNYYYMVESRTVWPNLWRVVNLIHILLILAHWFGCFYFLLSEAEGFQGDWVYPYRPGDYATLTRKYLGSLYWSTLTLTTIGDLPTPETNAEYVFTIVSYLIGVFIFATIVGQVGNVITNRNANRLEFERLLDGAKTYMRHHKVPGGMKKRVLRWYDYSWSRGRIQGGGDINTALGLLPDKLKTELALHVNLSVLKKVTIFQECQPEFLHDLVLKMKAYIFTPGDSICRKGEVAREMFIIADGILEVLSEAGRVLTTMKAGDFFGEIGILNLDGLNKRTADVRSVGYSELFSLSREDVLAAMKDYPEAQEILQALGRKRLMEVKNSARIHSQTQRGSKHHRSVKNEEGHEKESTDSSSRGLVGKIKSEAKGLRNVLRKSRVYRQKSNESLELQPLHTPSKGVLKRMPRVRSDEISQEDAPDPGGGEEKTATVTSPLGAGLPLLSRLRLLKEKQDNEERRGMPLASPSSVVNSPPPVPEAEEPPQEVIGAGLPLLQRLLLLKAKEDRQAAAVATSVKLTSAFSGGGAVGGATVEVSKSPPITAALSPKPALGKVSFRDRIFATRSNVASTSLAPPVIPTPAPKPESPKKHPPIETVTTPAEPREEPPSASTPDVVRDTRDSSNMNNSGACGGSFQSESGSGNVSVSGSVTKISTNCNIVKPPTIVGYQLKNIERSAAHLSPNISQDSDLNDPWSKLKHAAICRDNSQSQLLPLAPPPQSTPLPNHSPSETTPSTSSKRTKPNLLQLQNPTKHYESVDDLSPEYCGLPFVKKLKILNERQKLAQLETAMQTRSISLDIPDTQGGYDDSTLTRSHSEASAMHRKNTTRSSQPEAGSPESNETPERRNLKSILKKLSEDARPVTTTTTTTTIIGPHNERLTSSTSTDFRQLMRAQTIEGYAARHSKLAKSVTFDRETLQTSTDQPVMEYPEVEVKKTEISVQSMGIQVEEFRDISAGLVAVGVQTGFSGNELSPLVERMEEDLLPTSPNRVKFVKTPLEEHEYFGEALIAIKQVISAHLQDMQVKFQQRFDKLEEEVKTRDKVIGHLRQHIHELERSFDESYTGSDSLSTVISRSDHRSWDDPSNQESMELQDLPESINPQQAWSSESPRYSPIHQKHYTNKSPTNSDTVVLDLDSATDTESELGDSDAQPDLDFKDDQYGVHRLSHSNWEVEMLAAQMRQQRRSHSFDHNSMSMGGDFSGGGPGGSVLGGRRVSGGRDALTRRRLLCRGYSADAHKID